MRSGGIPVWLGCLFALLLLASPVLAEGPAPDAEGFIPLFNGKDLSGWTVKENPEGFRVADGIIRSETGWGGQLMYYTGREFSDFVLRVEWRVSPGGNSGVFIRAPQEGWPWETAYEVQISNEQPPRDTAHCTGALYGYAGVTTRPDESPEKWHSYEITCKGPRITVAVDGVQVLDFDQSGNEKTKSKPLKGFIGVQDSHGPEGTWIEYRSIRVKPLD